jgi:hypothetical protein
MDFTYTIPTFRRKGRWSGGDHPMTLRELKRLVDNASATFSKIEHREWDGHRYGKSQTDMWQEASTIAPPEWQEVVRVLAQGGDYYGIEWPLTLAA